MDKNFVDIDNLVRQRLGGGEEKEPSGAWQNMRELLDKEMPQESPVGVFFWRKMLTVIGVLLLTGVAGVGGYKMVSNATNGSTENGNGEMAAVSAANTPVKADGVDKQITGSGIQDNNQGGNADNKQNSTAANYNGANANSNPSATTGGNGSTNAVNNHVIAGSNSNNVNSNELGNNNTDKNKTTGNNTTDNNTAANKNQPNRNTTTVNGMPVAAANNNTTVNNNDHKNGTPQNTGVAGNNSTTKNTSAAAATKTANDKKNVAVANKNGTKQTGNVTATTTNNKQSKNANTNNVNADKNRTAATTTRNTSAANNTTNKQTEKTHVSADKMAVGSNASTTNNGSAVSADKVINTKPEAGKNNNTANNGNTGTRSKEPVPYTVPVFVTKTGSRISGDKLQKINMDRAKQNSVDNNSSNINTLKNKRVIQKMDIKERFIKTTPTEGFYKLDTISVTTLTEELGIITETKTVYPNKSGQSNGETENKATADPKTAPAASPKATKPRAKETSSIKKSGTMVMENLSAAFNDIKYSVARMQFAPGLTAGINGTFFGPSSFKGFQFGFTGTFIFTDKLAVMTELKYFHRINNNYFLSDDYYTYTAVNGGYKKEHQANSYNFSTLHSFELPVAVRFSEGKFNFFAGGNFVYTFAVNTGAASQADPASATTVTTIGNDNAPKLKEKDFDSRFGIGYLFGASYQVSHNVTLDVRSVQTVWDNAKSSGSKMISNQLYRSPSLQFSIGYRLGGNRNKE